MGKSSMDVDGQQASETEIQCVLCEKWKPQTKEFWNKEHIVPKKFGNNGDNTPALLENKICKDCNSGLGDSIDKHFLRYSKSREIRSNHGMKCGDSDRETGSSFLTEYNTYTVHLLECIKIAFESHVKFFSSEYRDDVFHTLRKLLLYTMEAYKKYDTSPSDDEDDYVADKDDSWANIGQGIVIAENINIIHNHVYKSDYIIDNYADFIKELKARSSHGTYANLVQICRNGNFGIFALVGLQSWEPLAIRISNNGSGYAKDFGPDCAHVMDLRSDLKRVVSEKNLVETILPSVSDKPAL